MASIQSRIIQFAIRRQNLFGGRNFNPYRLRVIIEREAATARPVSQVRISAVDDGLVRSEWLVPPGAPADCALLYVHSGGWFMGSARTARAIVSRLALASGIRALAIDYRLVPENPFPAGLEDCLAAYAWLRRNGIPSHHIVAAGDSAGGNLVLAMLVALRDAGRPLPAGAVALSAPTDLAVTGPSRKTRARLDPHFGQNSGLENIIRNFIGERDPRSPLISPLYADLRGLPPLLQHVGDHEVLLDDSVRFGERAKAAGVEVETVVWPGMFHGFQTLDPLLPEAREANAQIGAFIRSRLGGNQAKLEKS